MEPSGVYLEMMHLSQSSLNDIALFRHNSKCDRLMEPLMAHLPQKQTRHIGNALGADFTSAGARQHDVATIIKRGSTGGFFLMSDLSRSKQ